MDCTAQSVGVWHVQDRGSLVAVPSSGLGSIGRADPDRDASLPSLRQPAVLQSETPVSWHGGRQPVGCWAQGTHVPAAASGNGSGAKDPRTQGRGEEWPSQNHGPGHSGDSRSAGTGTISERDRGTRRVMPAGDKQYPARHSLGRLAPASGWTYCESQVPSTSSQKYGSVVHPGVHGAQHTTPSSMPAICLRHATIASSTAMPQPGAPPMESMASTHPSTSFSPAFSSRCAPMHADASSNPRANTLRMLTSVRPFPTPRKVNGGAACP